MGAYRRIAQAQEGQAAVILVLFLVVLLGGAALAIDAGIAYATRLQLQSTCEAAALAGAADLPYQNTAIATALEYAGRNGIKATRNGVQEHGDTVTVSTPYAGDPDLIRVQCSRVVEHYFARVLGRAQTEVTAASTARRAQWAGEALPFINLDDDYDADPEVVAWEKVDPGDFESIQDYEIVNRTIPSKLYFYIDYLQGVTLKKGTVATIKQEVGYVFESHRPDKPVYVLSLSSAVVRSGQVRLKDGTVRQLSKLKNGDVVDPSQLVLLKCIFHDYDYSGKTLFLTVLDVYHIMHGQRPPDYRSPDGPTARLTR